MTIGELLLFVAPCIGRCFVCFMEYKATRKLFRLLGFLAFVCIDLALLCLIGAYGVLPTKDRYIFFGAFRLLLGVGSTLWIGEQAAWFYTRIEVIKE